MNRHIATITGSEYDQLISGTRNYLLKFFKKKPDFLGKLSLGDTVFFKKEKGEIAGQFEIGKLIVIENPDGEDWGLVEKYEKGLTREKYLDWILTFRFLLFLKIDKLEQLITSPVETNKRSKKEWEVLEI